MKKFTIYLSIYLSIALTACKKEVVELYTPKSIPGFVTLPDNIRNICSAVDDPNEAELNNALFDVLIAYAYHYKSSQTARDNFNDYFFSSETRNVLISDLIVDEEEFFYALSNSSYSGINECSDYESMQAFFTYEGYSYDVLLSYFNKPNPNVSFNNSIIFALGQDFDNEDESYDDVIPALLIEYEVAASPTFTIQEIGISEDIAYQTNIPLIVFNYIGVGDTIDDNYPKYTDEPHPIDTVINDKASYFNLNVTGLKANHRFESSVKSEFIIHQFHNYCCQNGWGPNASYSEEDPVYKIHKNKIGQHLSANWNIWSYYNVPNYGEEYWWTKLAVYEWDWWASGKNTNIRIANSTNTMGWQIQAKFKHEWYLAVPTFKNDIMFTYNNQTIQLSTPNGYIYLTRK